MTGSIPSNRSPMTDGWLVFSRLLSECVSRDQTDAAYPQDVEARVTRQVRALRVLHDWWNRPLPDAAGTSAIDAATRLEIHVRGGFPR